MNILSITIITSPTSGDQVNLNTDVPEGAWPFQGFASFRTTVAKGSGMIWVAKHFPEIKDVKIIPT